MKTLNQLLKESVVETLLETRQAQNPYNNKHYGDGRYERQTGESEKDHKTRIWKAHLEASRYLNDTLKKSTLWKGRSLNRQTGETNFHYDGNNPMQFHPNQNAMRVGAKPLSVHRVHGFENKDDYEATHNIHQHLASMEATMKRMYGDGTTNMMKNHSTEYTNKPAGEEFSKEASDFRKSNGIGKFSEFEGKQGESKITKFRSMVGMLTKGMGTAFSNGLYSGSGIKKFQPVQTKE